MRLLCGRRFLCGGRLLCERLQWWEVVTGMWKEDSQILRYSEPYSSNSL